jgi:hypothetical protein
MALSAHHKPASVRSGVGSLLPSMPGRGVRLKVTQATGFPFKFCRLRAVHVPLPLTLVLVPHRAGGEKGGSQVHLLLLFAPTGRPMFCTCQEWHTTRYAHMHTSQTTTHTRTQCTRIYTAATTTRRHRRKQTASHHTQPPRTRACAAPPPPLLPLASVCTSAQVDLQPHTRILRRTRECYAEQRAIMRRNL